MSSVSVVIPTFNREKYILSTLDSVANQTVLPDMVVVVDDGSTDNSLAIINHWVARHPDLKIEVIRTDNRGASAARNLGLETIRAEHEYVAFLDSDDIWPPDFLERTLSSLSNQPDAVAVSTDREFIFPADNTRSFSSLAGITANPWQWLLLKDAGIGSCTLLRTTAVVTAGGYPVEQATGHDVILFGRIALTGTWLHAPGQPTQFTRFDPKHHSKVEHHTFQRYTDHLYRWACAATQLWNEAPPFVRKDSASRKALANRWYKAARQLRKIGEVQKARLAFKRAHTLHPLKTKYLKARILSKFW